MIYIINEIPILIETLRGKHNIYRDIPDNIIIDITLIIMQLFMVDACAPPVDFLIIPTSRKIIILSYQKSNNTPKIEIMTKIDAICNIAMIP